VEDDIPFLCTTDPITEERRLLHFSIKTVNAGHAYELEMLPQSLIRNRMKISSIMTVIGINSKSYSTVGQI
jgi:hypothetical protein